MTKNKILITGGSGFIGYHLCKRILDLKKYQLTCVDVKKKNNYFIKELLKNKNFKYLKLDLNQLSGKKFSNFKFVFHLAAIVGVKQVNKKPLDSFTMNAFIFSKLVNNLKKYSPKTKIIFFSTSEVYGPLSDLGKLKYPTNEDINLIIPSMTRARDSYYLSKIFGEKILELSKLNYCILRPHNIYGPNMGFKHVISELIKKFNMKKNTCKIYSPDHTRSFCYIDDAVNQIIGLSFNDKSNRKTFNIGNPKEEIKIKKLAILIKKLLGSKKRLIYGPNTKGSPKRRVPNVNKTFKLIDKKNFTPLKLGIKKTIIWYEKL